MEEKLFVVNYYNLEREIIMHTFKKATIAVMAVAALFSCLLYTSDAADE